MSIFIRICMGRSVNSRCAHVGIDINSMESVTFAPWSGDVTIREGMECAATINYESGSGNLSIVFTGDENISQSLSHVIDLKEYLPEFVTFGFSAATSYDYPVLQTILSWSFSSTLEVNLGNKTDSGTGKVNGTVKDPGRVTTGDMNHNETGPGIKSSNSKIRLIIGLAGGGSVLLVITGLLIYFFLKNRKTTMNEVDGSVDGPKKFFFHVLKRATNNFSKQEKLGEGGFGGVYKGYLKETDTYIAVKRVSRQSSQGIKEYASEVKIISKLRHINLVQLLGWCHEKKELLLVYELMPNGSLDFHLFRGKSLLDWETRFKIAQGLASALLYLHEEGKQCVVHRDIKSSNVMLDAKFNAKLGDFGLARLVDHEKSSKMTEVAGTMGYMAPEYVGTGKASKETDVFSFGVVALEIASGRMSIDHMAERSQVNLVHWIWSLYGTGKHLGASDPQLRLEFDLKEMDHLMTVGLWCAHPDSKLRPSIREALRVLRSEAHLPDLPRTMPVYSPSHETFVSAQQTLFASSPEASSPSTSLMH